MNKINSYLENRKKNNFQFVPDFNFYKTVKINRKRWGMILRNEIEPSMPELESIATFFECEIDDIYIKTKPTTRCNDRT